MLVSHSFKDSASGQWLGNIKIPQFSRESDRVKAEGTHPPATAAEIREIRFAAGFFGKERRRSNPGAVPRRIRYRPAEDSRRGAAPSNHLTESCLVRGLETFSRGGAPRRARIRAGAVVYNQDQDRRVLFRVSSRGKGPRDPLLVRAPGRPAAPAGARIFPGRWGQGSNL